METNFYSSNMQKILFVARELHLRGYENFRVIPGLSATGLAWRCQFVCENDTQNKIPVSNWIDKQNDDVTMIEIKLSFKELADKFERENLEFLQHCKGGNRIYTQWYKEALEQLEPNELPYAYCDYFTAHGNWETTKEKLIKLLPDENKYF